MCVLSHGMGNGMVSTNATEDSWYVGDSYIAKSGDDVVYAANVLNHLHVWQ
jgi:hypothetical protein